MKYSLQIDLKIKTDLEIVSDVEIIEVSESNLSKHMKKRNHKDMIKYIPNIPEILSHPNFVGKNRNGHGTSFECIKTLEDNVLVAVKLDQKNNKFYVASLYDVKDSKLERMLQNGRIRKFDSE
jgi:hypothetical protein